MQAPCPGWKLHQLWCLFTYSTLWRTHGCVLWRVAAEKQALAADGSWLRVQRNLFHLMGWLDPQLFRRVAAMAYGGGSDAAPEPYKDAGRSHWKKVVVSSDCC